jgi:hypothetical protein
MLIAYIRRSAGPAHFSRDGMTGIQTKDGPEAERLDTRPRRVTYISQYFSTPDSRGGRRDWEFARRLAADGHTVTMICGGDRRRYRVGGFDVVSVGGEYENAMTVPRRLIAFFLFMIGATGAALRTPTDVVLASSTPLTVAVPGVLAARLRRVPFVFEVRDLWPAVPVALGYLRGFPARVAALLEAWAYRHADHVIPLSPQMADGVRAVRGDVPMTVVPNASDIEAYSATREERSRIREELGWGEEPVLVYAGSFGASYDVGWTVHLAARLRDDGVRFVALGRGTSTPTLRAKAERLGLDAAALLPGGMPNAEAVRYVIASDAAISTLIDNEALHGNSLNKVFDACAAGRPVFFNHGGWLSDLLCERGAGWRLDRDPDRAAAQLREILEDRLALADAGAEAARLGRTTFARDALYEAWSCAVVGTRRRRGGR